MYLKLKLSRQLKTDITGYTFILPNILGMIIFTLFPLLFSLFISFTDWDFTKGLGNWNFNFGANYIEMWKDGWFTSSLFNTILYSLMVVPISIFLALVLAVILESYCFAKVPMKLAMFMPYISNIVAVAIVWVMMYSPWGPFTLMIKALGWETPPAWLGDYNWALIAVTIMSIWSSIGYNILIYSSAIQGLPQDVYEAADVDGASEITKFFKITIPSLSPTTFFLVITTLINSFQVFAPIQIMTRGGPGTSTSVLVYYIYTTGFTFFRMGYASAIAWVLFLLLLIVTLIQWRGQKKWVSYE
ncbi:carbohydrate ABC transporter permease [Ruminiclostridium papyrosolvens]|uniref:Sugar ABC transporter permease n=1 Tax=Ruminiclostridium papyrosolvens C7 TaxID=1330534 RepID=U4QZD8_9FIRM|nr:sugar ABC transporter permease [Ruminiclostridium papyrosolvens]EPR10352.1 sugar ABC transporter permease [Ruminiclostridium papyrosolvens C7]